MCPAHVFLWFAQLPKQAFSVGLQATLSCFITMRNQRKNICQKQLVKHSNTAALSPEHKLVRLDKMECVACVLRLNGDVWQRTLSMFTETQIPCETGSSINKISVSHLHQKQCLVSRYGSGHSLDVWGSFLPVLSSSRWKSEALGK